MISMTRLGRDGQLGNQLFQYAMLRAVAARRGFTLKIPKTFNGVKQKDMVELERFYIEADELSKVDAAQLTNKFKHEEVTFNPAVFEQPDGTDYSGWYQTEKYFADIRPTLLREFRSHCDIDFPCSAFIAEARAGSEIPLISMHIRRGDYVKHSNKFRVLGVSYYLEALEQICSQLGTSKVCVLVFSDDLAWCHSNLKLPAHVNTIFVQGVSHWHDLCTMSKCDHHVIAASSFSWWGAWLNTSPQQVVVAPKPWFNSGLPYDTTDLIPERWLQLETLENYV